MSSEMVGFIGIVVLVLLLFFSDVDWPGHAVCWRMGPRLYGGGSMRLWGY